MKPLSGGAFIAAFGCLRFWKTSDTGGTWMLCEKQHKGWESTAHWLQGPNYDLTQLLKAWNLTLVGTGKDDAGRFGKLAYIGGN